MSLDVCLKIPGVPQSASQRIYIREDGRTREITRAEWDARYPDREPFAVTVGEIDGGSCVYSANITHNLSKMAQEAGICQALWMPEEIGITHAEQLIAPLCDGLALLNSDPARFRRLNPENGWGTYEGLAEFVAAYLAACEKWPMAEVSVWR